MFNSTFIEVSKKTGKFQPFKKQYYFVNFLDRNTVKPTAQPKIPTRMITGVIFSPVLGRTFFLPVFGISLFSVVVGSEGFDVVVVVDELDEELELDEEDELDEELELDEKDELDEELELEVGGVCSFSPKPSPEPDSNLTSRVKLRGSGKLVAFHVKVL